VRKYIVPVKERDKSGNMVVGTTNGPYTIHRTNSESCTVLEIMSDNKVQALNGDRLKIRVGHKCQYLTLKADLKAVQKFIQPKYYFR
jgi:hypothetical protein